MCSSDLFPSHDSLRSIRLSSEQGPVINDFNPKVGKVGATVTIKGTRLASATLTPVVTFADGKGGRLKAVVRSANSNEVNVTVPEGTGNGVIELSTPSGQARTNEPFMLEQAVEFAVVVAPAAVEAAPDTTVTHMVSLSSPQVNFNYSADLAVVGLPAGVKRHSLTILPR